MYSVCPKCGGNDDNCDICRGHGLIDENGNPPESDANLTKVHEDELN